MINRKIFCKSGPRSRQHASRRMPPPSHAHMHGQTDGSKTLWFRRPIRQGDWGIKALIQTWEYNPLASSLLQHKQQAPAVHPFFPALQHRHSCKANKSVFSFLRCQNTNTAQICCWPRHFCGYGLHLLVCCRRAVQQLISSACLTGSQQQTGRMPWLRQQDGTDGGRDTVSLHSNLWNTFADSGTSNLCIISQQWNSM